MELGPVGLWTHALDTAADRPGAGARGRARRARATARSCCPRWPGRDPLVFSGLLLGATSRIVIGTGIAGIYSRDALTMNGGHRALTEAFPDRFLLGLGVSHAVAVEGLRGQTYDKPLTKMREYLDAMDDAPYFAYRVRRDAGPRARRARPEDARARRVTRRRRAPVLRAGRAHRVRARAPRARRAAAARAEGGARDRPGRRRAPSAAARWRSTSACPTTRTTCGGSASATTTSPTAAPTGSSTRSSRGATRTRSRRGSTRTTPPARTTWRSRCVPADPAPDAVPMAEWRRLAAALL